MIKIFIPNEGVAARVTRMTADGGMLRSKEQDEYYPIFYSTVPRTSELYGLDLHEHGISAYPEYVVSSLAAPAGIPKELTVHGSVTVPASNLSALTSPAGD